MAGGEAKGGEAQITLEHTPTWIVAAICSVIVVISLLFERMLHRLGKKLTKGRWKPLHEALLKVKEGYATFLLCGLCKWATSVHIESWCMSCCGHQQKNDS